MKRRGGVRAAATYSLICIAKLDNVESRVWLADLLDRIAGTPPNLFHKLLHWTWQNGRRYDRGIR